MVCAQAIANRKTKWSIDEVRTWNDPFQMAMEQTEEIENAKKIRLTKFIILKSKRKIAIEYVGSLIFESGFIFLSLIILFLSFFLFNYKSEASGKEQDREQESEWAEGKHEICMEIYCVFPFNNFPKLKTVQIGCQNSREKRVVKLSHGFEQLSRFFLPTTETSANNETLDTNENNSDNKLLFQR